jgi:hypothetical protein
MENASLALKTCTDCGELFHSLSTRDEFCEECRPVSTEQRRVLKVRAEVATKTKPRLRDQRRRARREKENGGMNAVSAS